MQTRTLYGDPQVHSPLDNKQTGAFEGIEPETVADEAENLDFVFYTSHEGYPDESRVDRLRELAQPRTLIHSITEVIAHERDDDHGWHVAIIPNPEINETSNIGPHCSFRELYSLKEQDPKILFGLYHAGLPAGIAPQKSRDITNLIKRHPGLFDIYELVNGALLHLDKFQIACSIEMLDAGLELLNQDTNIAFTGGTDARKPGENLPVGSVRTKVDIGNGRETVFDALYAGDSKVEVSTKVNPHRWDELKAKSGTPFRQLTESGLITPIS